MGVHDKTRLLGDGLPLGMKFSETNGQKFVRFSDLPFELEEVVLRWIAALTASGQAEVLLVRDGSVLGIRDEGWEAFLAWMLVELDDALRRPDVGKRVDLQLARFLEKKG